MSTEKLNVRNMFKLIYLHNEHANFSTVAFDFARLQNTKNNNGNQQKKNRFLFTFNIIQPTENVYLRGFESVF